MIREEDISIRAIKSQSEGRAQPGDLDYLHSGSDRSLSPLPSLSPSVLGELLLSPETPYPTIPRKSLLEFRIIHSISYL